MRVIVLLLDVPADFSIVCSAPFAKSKENMVHILTWRTLTFHAVIHQRTTFRHHFCLRTLRRLKHGFQHGFLLFFYSFFVQIVFHCFGKLPNGGECVADFSDFRRHGLNNRGMTLWRWKVDRSSFAHWGSRQEKDKQTNADPSDPGELTLIHCFDAFPMVLNLLLSRRVGNE